MGAHASRACVPDGEDQPFVRALGPSPAARAARAHWGIARGLQTVALDAPGGDGRPRCETREARGILGCLRRASSVPHGPGRQREVLDWQWRQTLHRAGWLAASWWPDAALVALRPRLRHRAP